MDNSFNNAVDKLCFGSIYSHIKNKNSGNLIPDQFAIRRGRRYVMISTLMYLNTPIALLYIFNIVSPIFWLIYAVATIAFIFPFGFSILNNQRVEKLCKTYTQSSPEEVRKADNAWRLFYHIGVTIFLISVLLALILH